MVERKGSLFFERRVSPLVDLPMAELDVPADDERLGRFLPELDGHTAQRGVGVPLQQRLHRSPPSTSKRYIKILRSILPDPA